MPETTTPRMRQLQQLLERQPSDTFLLYGLALEYKKLEDFPHALQYLDRVIQLDAGYCYAYHQKGQTYEQMSEPGSARRAYQEGIAAARKVGDAHAMSEIESALMALD